MHLFIQRLKESWSGQKNAGKFYIFCILLKLTLFVLLNKLGSVSIPLVDNYI